MSRILFSPAKIDSRLAPHKSRRGSKDFLQNSRFRRYLNSLSADPDHAAKHSGEKLLRVPDNIRVNLQKSLSSVRPTDSSRESSEDTPTVGPWNYSHRTRGFWERSRAAESWREQHGGKNFSIGTERLQGDNIPAVFRPLRNAAKREVGEMLEDLKQALRRNDPHAVLYTLIRSIRLEGKEHVCEMLTRIPATMFSEVLRSLDPNFFLGRYGRLLQEISPYTWTLLGLGQNGAKSYHEFCDIFTDQLKGIISARYGSQKSLCLEDYKRLLKCTRVVGHRIAAYDLWVDMQAGNIIPDTEVYNEYLAIRCESDRPSAFRKNVHKEPFQAEASRLFQSMLDLGLSGNEDTFCSMISAMARDSNTAGIASLLQRVWGIDVEALMSIDEANLAPVKTYSRDSPLHPSDALLLALARAYGSNSSVSIAVRVVDYVSRKFDIPIPIHVWEEIFESTFILANFSRGRLPAWALSSLWTTMTSEPYNVKPSMKMYNQLIINLMQRELFADATAHMEEGLAQHRQVIHEMARRFAILNRPGRDGMTWTAEKQRREIAFLHLRARINRVYLRRWVRLWLKDAGTTCRNHDEFMTRTYPNFLKDWFLFSPRRVTYQVRGGTVSFRTRYKEAVRRVLMNMGARGSRKDYPTLEDDQRAFAFQNLEHRSSSRISDSG